MKKSSKNEKNINIKLDNEIFEKLRFLKYYYDITTKEIFIEMINSKFKELKNEGKISKDAIDRIENN